MANDLIIDTQSHCFLCLSETSNEFSSPSSKSLSPLTHSIQYLSKALQLDRRKVFNEERAIPEHLVAKVTKSRLMVELCGSCTTWNDSFSEKYQQLEKIRMEVVSKLNHLRRKLVNEWDVSEIGDKVTDMDSGTTDDYEITKEKLGIADMLRKDVIYKCDQMLMDVAPRVKVQRLAKHAIRIPIKRDIPSKSVSDEVDNDYMDHLEDSGSPDSPMVSEPDIDDIDTKTNLIHLTRRRTNRSKKSDKTNIGQGQPNPKGQDMDGAVSSPTLELVSSKQEIPILPNMDEEDNPLNPDAQEVSVSIPAPKKLYHKSSRRILQHKCPLCPKQFRRNIKYETHYRSFHLGVRYKCLRCSKTFTERDNLRYHQLNSCGIGRRDHIPTCHCELCGRGYAYRHILQKHLRLDHRKVRDVPCNHCKRKFYLESELKEHQRTKHVML